MPDTIDHGSSGFESPKIHKLFAEYDHDGQRGLGEFDLEFVGAKAFVNLSYFLTKSGEKPQRLEIDCSLIRPPPPTPDSQKSIQPTRYAYKGLIRVPRLQDN